MQDKVTITCEHLSNLKDYVTQLEALETLFHSDHRIETRLWRSEGKSFHSKAYLIEDHVVPDPQCGITIKCRGSGTFS